MLRGSLHTLRVDSQLLRKNPLGDPHLRELPVYLPPDYDAKEARRYPTVTFLTGYTSSGPMLLNARGWDENTPQRLDRLIGSGQIPPVIGVFPDCWTRWGGSQYLDSAGTGPYMSHLVDELLPAVDDAFRTLPQPMARALTGISSGGYGALVTAMLRPGVFGLVDATAADCAFDLCYRPDLPAFVRTVEQAGGLRAFIDGFFNAKRKSGDQITAMMVIAMSACYSPDLTRTPIFAQLPVDLHSAELIPEVWERWLSRDPVRMVAEHAEALRSLRLLVLDAGVRDEYNLQFGHRILSRQLSEHDVEHELSEFSAGHRGIGYRQEDALQRIGAVIETEASQTSTTEG